MASGIISLLPGAWLVSPAVGSWGIECCVGGNRQLPLLSLHELAWWTSSAAAFLPCLQPSPPPSQLECSDTCTLIAPSGAVLFLQTQAPTTQGHTHTNNHLKTARGPNAVVSGPMKCVRWNQGTRARGLREYSPVSGRNPAVLVSLTSSHGSGRSLQDGQQP